jgi:hypothetical protein
VPSESVKDQDSSVQHGPLVQRGPDRAVQSIFQVQRALILHDVRKQITEKCRIFGK